MREGISPKLGPLQRYRSTSTGAGWRWRTGLAPPKCAVNPCTRALSLWRAGAEAFPRFDLQKGEPGPGAFPLQGAVIIFRGMGGLVCVRISLPRRHGRGEAGPVAWI